MEAGWTSDCIERPADLGVLLVHGIGRQVEGETLQTAAGTLTSWLQTLPDCRVTVQHCHLKPSLRNSPDPAATLLGVKHGGKCDRLLIAESHWANEFDPPETGKVARWLLTSGSWLALRETMATAVGRVRDWPLLRGSQLLPLLAGFFVGIPAAILILFPIQITLLLALLISSLPLPGVAALAARILKLVSEVLGDCYIYESDPIAVEAICTKIRSDLDWLRRRSKVTVILAHSQGAALAFRLLSRNAELRYAKLITFGAGIKKLVIMPRIESAHAWGLTIVSGIWLYTLLLFSALSIAREDVLQSMAAIQLNQPVAGNQTAGLAWFYIIGVYLICGGALAAASLPQRKELDCFKDDIDALCDVDWTDLFASADPVPGGRLLESASCDEKDWKTSATRFHCSEVGNEGSLVADHTAYWSSGGDFVPKVAFWLSRWSGLDWDIKLGEVLKAADARRRRLQLRTATRWLTLLLALCMFLFLNDRWYPVVDGIIRGNALPALLAAHPSIQFLVPFLIGAAEYLAGFALHLGGALAIVYFGLLPVWREWDRASMEAKASVFSRRPAVLLAIYFACVSAITFTGVEILRRGTYSLDWSRVVIDVGDPGLTNALRLGQIVLAVAFISWIVSHRRT